VGNDPVAWNDPLGLCGENPSGWAALRTAIQLADILPIPTPYYQVPMEIVTFGTNVYDIYVADVVWWRKAIAGGAALYG